MDKKQENKFNFSEEDSKDIEQSKEEIVKEAKGLFESISHFLSGILGFKQDTDRDATIDAIKNDIPFKGATAWILICSIFVASIGLNYNSTAVVIGAMLISPLMGPILGIGMSIAVNDIDVLRKSLINFAVMVVLSILTAYLFFELFPLRQDSSELIARTRPDIRDVLIAFFGGSALIIARTKKGTIASVIFGVAIATALMPPLCTVGYGLAKGFEPGLTEGSTGYSYALGALYLFTINTIFIALATFLVLKVLRFPMMKYVNSKKRRFIGRLAALLALVVMVPALWTFVNVLRESGYEQDYKKFLFKKISNNDDLWLRKETIDMKNKTIKLDFNGEVGEGLVTDLENTLKDKSSYPHIYDFKLTINGDQRRSYEMILGQLDKLYQRIEEKDDQLTRLRSELDSVNSQSLKHNEVNASAFLALANGAKEKFSDLQSFSYSKTFESKDFVNVDTLTVAHVKWNSTLSDSSVVANDSLLAQWLKKQLKINKIKVEH